MTLAKTICSTFIRCGIEPIAYVQLVRVPLAQMRQGRLPPRRSFHTEQWLKTVHNPVSRCNENPLSCTFGTGKLIYRTKLFNIGQVFTRFEAYPPS
jgi:hypothetical protein